MTTLRDPTVMVRGAWSVLRLPVLQTIVNDTIRVLEEIAPSELLGRELSVLDLQVERNPIAAALEACSAELRDESGILDAHERRRTQSEVVRENMLSQPAEWKQTFQEAFVQYRHAAVRSLGVSLDAPAAAS
jgi:hypothetical protein